MDVSVILVNYNTFDLTVQTIDGLKKFTKGLTYEIILIDNCSSDKCGERLKEKYKDEIVFIQASENLGTSKAVNKCVSVAKGKYVLWLNTDVIFIDNFIKILFDYMESNSKVGVCGGNLLDVNKKPAHSYMEALPNAKVFLKNKNVLLRVFNKIFKRRFFNQYNYLGKVKEVGYITGADMMVRKEIFDKVGNFDEDIFMYAEETEFQFRVKKLTDYKIVNVPNARLIHLDGGSFGKKYNENRHRLTTVGITTYLIKSFGVEEGKKFLIKGRTAYKKARLISRIIFNKDLTKEFESRAKINGEIIKDFDKIFCFNK